MRRLLLAAACALACTLPARAVGSLGISPLRVDLNASAMSGTLVVRNEGDAPADVLVSAQAWTQSGAQPVVLADTRDVVAYPPSFQLQPHQVRTIRVGTLRAPESTERAYRVIVTELNADDARGGALQFVTRLSVPVFVGGAGLAVPHVAGAAVRGTTVDVVLEGAAARHALVREVRVDALDAAGRTLESASLPGWYVLAGTEQRVHGRVGERVCARTARLRVRVLDDDDTTGEQTLVPERTCSGGA